MPPKETALGIYHRFLAKRLEQFLSRGGAIIFSQSVELRNKNAWLSVFAQQALCFYEAISSGAPLDNRWLQLLV
jgi:hypothetical protein